MITPKLVAKSCVFCNRDVACLPAENFPVCPKCETDMPGVREDTDKAGRKTEAGGAD